MSNSTDPHRVEIKDSDDRIVAAADVTAPPGCESARASLHATPGHAPAGSRARLVDAVLSTTEVQERTRLEATVPLGDAEALERIREEADELETRAAGATVLLDASVRPPPEPQPDPGEPGPS